MRFAFLCCLIALVISSCTKVITEPPVVDTTQIREDTSNLKNYNKDITIVNWNIEWFGSSSMFKGNPDLQEANAGKILKYLNADLYGICEVVDTARLGRMMRNSLGDEFRYKVSYYPVSLGSQKLAFIYNRNIFRNLTVRPFMGVSTSAYNSFAQRYPYLLKADVVVNGKRNEVSYILIHAKANADLDSYNRRLNGSIEMKDSLDRYFAGKNFMIMGDYNDHLNGSIVSGKSSPYKNIVDDAEYNPISLPLNTPGYQSTITYPNSVIDNQIISATLTKSYVNASVKVRTDITAVVPDYSTRNTSDHYPVSSVYSF